MSSRRARTIDEYVDLVDQAIFETEELRVAAEYDMESLGAVKDFVSELEQQLRKLRASMEDGGYRFENKDLPFMEIVNKKHERYLPFRFLLRMINDTHREGLDVEEI
jgi:hypothetical protein